MCKQMLQTKMKCGQKLLATNVCLKNNTVDFEVRISFLAGQYIHKTLILTDVFLLAQTAESILKALSA